MQVCPFVAPGPLAGMPGGNGVRTRAADRQPPAGDGDGADELLEMEARLIERYGAKAPTNRAGRASDMGSAWRVFVPMMNANFRCVWALILGLRPPQG